MIHYTPSADSPLMDMWPEGVTGELVHLVGRQFHIRVQVGYSTAMIVAPMERCAIL
jgi:hypothetical protein